MRWKCSSALRPSRRASISAASGGPIRLSGTARGGVTVFRDVTERVRAEEALAQAFAQGRLEVMDTILHNIGNAITSVAIGIGTLKEELGNNPLIERLAALLRDCRGACGGLGRLRPARPARPTGAAVSVGSGRRLRRAESGIGPHGWSASTAKRTTLWTSSARKRGFASKAMTSKDVNLNQAISSALKIMQDSFASRRIQTHVDCGNAPAEIRIQETQFNQMLVNLLKNAMEAIDELKKSGGLKGPPRIEIRACIEQDFPRP